MLIPTASQTPPAVRRRDLRPTYRLIIGSPGKSNAFAALKLGLDPNIIEDAKKRISGDEKRFELLVEKLEESRIEMERQRDEAARLRREYEAFKAEQEEKIRRRLAEAERELEKAQAKAIQIVESAKLTSEFVLEELEELSVSAQVKCLAWAGCYAK